MSNDRLEKISAIERSFNDLIETSQKLVMENEKETLKKKELSIWNTYIEELKQEFDKVEKTLDNTELNDVVSTLKITNIVVVPFISQGISAKASIQPIIDRIKNVSSYNFEDKHQQQYIEQRKYYATKKLIGGTAFCSGIALYAMGIVAAVIGIGLIPALAIGGVGFLVSAVGGLGFGKSFFEHYSLKKEYNDTKNNSIYNQKLGFFNKLITKQTSLIESSFTNLDNANKL